MDGLVARGSYFLSSSQEVHKWGYYGVGALLPAGSSRQDTMLLPTQSPCVLGKSLVPGGGRDLAAPGLPGLAGGTG